MRVLVACEHSGVVRRAFRERGHEAFSCDIIDSDDAGQHIHCDCKLVIDDSWDLIIAHPPCTHLAVSGARWFKGKEKEQQEALEFVELLLNAKAPMICVENPISIISTRIRKPDQIVQPWWFGDSVTKTTCLWLKGLPKLLATDIVDPGPRHVTKSGRSLPKWYNLPPSENRAKLRGITFSGMAKAMAEQWG